MQVKETFFTLLKPFINKIDDFIDNKQKSNTAIFGSYFMTDAYLSHFETMDDVLNEKPADSEKKNGKWTKFAKALIESSSF